MAYRPIAIHGDKVGGGDIIASSVNVKVYGGQKVARHGDPVTPHGTGPHAAATLIASQTDVLVEGIPVCRHGDFATCGHTIDTTSNPLNLGFISVAD